MIRKREGFSYIFLGDFLRSVENENRRQEIQDDEDNRNQSCEVFQQKARREQHQRVLMIDVALIGIHGVVIEMSSLSHYKRES